MYSKVLKKCHCPVIFIVMHTKWPFLLPHSSSASTFWYIKYGWNTKAAQSKSKLGSPGPQMDDPRSPDVVCPSPQVQVVAFVLSISTKNNVYLGTGKGFFSPSSSVIFYTWDPVCWIPLVRNEYFQRKKRDSIPFLLPDNQLWLTKGTQSTWWQM